MRIALVQPKFDGSGGAERYALTLGEALSGRGHEVHLFGRKAGPVPPGLTFHRVAALPFGRALKTWSFCRFASAAVRGGRFDVIQGSGKTVCQTVHRAGGGAHAAYLERSGPRRLSAYDRLALRLEAELFSSPTLRAVIAPSAWVASEVERWHPAAAVRIHVIPNGVDTERFRPEGREADRQALCAAHGIPAGAPLLLFAATNFRLKGLAEAVEALALLPEAHLAVAGGDDPGPFREAAARAGAAARLHFLGRIGDMAPVYRAADVLLHPTHYDPFPNVCGEAVACGTPPVTTDRAGATELVAGAGLVVRFPATGEVLAAAVRALLERGDEGRARCRAVACRFDLAAHAHAVEALYEAVRRGDPVTSGVEPPTPFERDHVH
ncbi:MAG: glycosyltransferase family 4 protein [Deltaproteobacteria bacterium]|nr:glycosyltransferase family 4 protein [Deltaproteobacteria bacterium]